MSSPRTVAFHTLGCKLNFSETSTLARSLEEAGYARVRVEERPDVFVLNTCSVTENADKECRRHVRRFQAINPEAFIAVVGCYAQLKPEQIAAIPGVGLVLGANEKFDLAAHIDECHSGLEPESQELGEEELGGLRQELGEKELGGLRQALGEEEQSVGNEGLVRLRLKAGVSTHGKTGVASTAKAGVSTHGKAGVATHGKGGVVRAGAIKDVRAFIPSYNANDPASGEASAGARTRTFLKVQDGCDYFCSFCTIPLARGRSRSATIAETVEQARQIARTGVQEIVLTGVNTGDFGKSSALRGSTTRAGTEDFMGLIEALDRVEGIARFRISSIEPNLCHDGVIDFVAGSQRFAPHFHMPLQSGSDVILERMRRRYDTALYAERVQRIKERMPHACIGVDVITGTPGETEEEFLKTHAFLRSIPVDYLHVFTYSERANTTAVRMEDAVPMEVRRERTKQLRILGSKFQRTHYERHMGTTRPVLFEHGERPEAGIPSSDRIEGYTDNYIRVSLPYDPALANTIVPVTLERINGDGHATGMVGTLEPGEVDPVGRRYRWPVATSPIAN